MTHTVLITEEKKQQKVLSNISFDHRQRRGGEKKELEVFCRFVIE